MYKGIVPFLDVEFNFHILFLSEDSLFLAFLLAFLLSSVIYVVISSVISSVIFLCHVFVCVWVWPRAFEGLLLKN